ncbi:uncharacterized protein L969DRAFT_105059 [Mixia osmundae IAM 14324]|uniref:Nucleotide-diphospho-sugar transferase domain-containing protein n=1 Tax=Mixia osmundae (strain CBS 9802 / IAM 14324 / JCM 22182 / KY 12970) TaxID=764103 RepID=G7DV10_MIXOS|nr:uncharacterized protein L969DRAFT_105059 [Mixia osmundae IAM 14324]KEI37247.1 hypothetical protein L969DRAFT_105059 [Mixia osmundae IAM 14324]GAA94420.1 hypothetical protein E5Q_01072 [Mixia osmundae IAM 14324]
MPLTHLDVIISLTSLSDRAVHRVGQTLQDGICIRKVPRLTQAIVVFRSSLASNFSPIDDHFSSQLGPSPLSPLLLARPIWSALGCLRALAFTMAELKHRYQSVVRQRRRRALAVASTIIFVLVISLLLPVTVDTSRLQQDRPWRTIAAWSWLGPSSPAGTALVQYGIGAASLFGGRNSQFLMSGDTGYAQGRAAETNLITFISSQIGAPRAGRPIWAVIGGGFYLENALPQLAAYLDALQLVNTADAFKRPPGPKLGGHPDEVYRNLSAADTPKPALLVICLDEACMSQCASSGLMCFIYDKPEDFPEQYKKLSAYFAIGWQKATALADLASAGHSVVFSDLDVFFQGNVFEYLHDIEDGAYDIQMQDECNESLNIGFFAQRGTSAVETLWRTVANDVAFGGSWDQRAVNDFLDVRRLRTANYTTWPPISSFVSPTGLKVYVIDKARVWARMSGLMPPASVVGLHLTCPGPAELRLHDAKENGFWHDVNRYYTDPPRILTIGALAGNQTTVARQVKVMLALARATGRAFVPPSQVYVVSRLPQMTVTEYEHLHSIGISSPTQEDRLQHANATDIKMLDAPAIYHRRFPAAINLERLLHLTDVTILEPSYLRNALRYLVSSASAARVAQRPVDSMLLNTYQHALDTLSSEPYASAPVLTIMDHDDISRFEPPRDAVEVPLCRTIETPERCGLICA